MTERLSDKVREYIKPIQGRTINIHTVRQELKIDPTSPAYEGIRVVFHRLVEEKLLRPSGKKDGEYKVVQQVLPVQVYGQPRERRPVFNLIFPRAWDTGMMLDFAEHVVVREGDLITIGGVKSTGKTTLCILFCAENANLHPVLMGNEYTVSVEGKFEPSPRFLNRLDRIAQDGILWVDEDGMDKFKLLPIKEDYAEHVEKDKINIIDWINLDGDKSYDISKVLGSIKESIGRGVAIVALQKGEGAVNPRGGQYVRDYSDLEIILDSFSEFQDDILLTLKGCKEKTAPIVGKTYAYTIQADGTEIINFREVVKCADCFGRKIIQNKPCSRCRGTGYMDK